MGCPEISTQKKLGFGFWVVSESGGNLEKNSLIYNIIFFQFLGLALGINFKNKIKSLKFKIYTQKL
jgi:hypothetical protein